MVGSNPSIGADWRMSRACPWGSPSMMSMLTTSASPFWTTRIAGVAPTNPLPTTVTRISQAYCVGGGSRPTETSQAPGSKSFAEQRANPVLRQRRGLGCVHEFNEGAYEQLRLLNLREMPGGGEDLQPAPRDRLVRHAPVSRRNDRVSLPPHDERGDIGSKREPIRSAHTLPAGVDHRAERVDESNSRL